MGVLDADRINRGSYKDSKIFKIERYFDRIEFVIQNTSFYFDPENALSKSKGANISEGVLLSLSIESDDLFLNETFKEIKPASKIGAPTAFKLVKLDKNKSKKRTTSLEVALFYLGPHVSF